jgi:hypothetical protein
MSLRLRLKKLDSEKKTIEVYVKTNILGLDGNAKVLTEEVPVEEIKFNDIIIFRVREDYCTPERLNDICETVGELKKRGMLKANAFVVPEWIELCELCPESLNEQSKQ